MTEIFILKYQLLINELLREDKIITLEEFNDMQKIITSKINNLSRQYLMENK